MSEAVSKMRSLGDSPGDRRHPSPRAEYVSFGALLAEVLQERQDDSEILGFSRARPIESLRPKSAA